MPIVLFQSGLSEVAYFVNEACFILNAWQNKTKKTLIHIAKLNMFNLILIFFDRWWLCKRVIKKAKSSFIVPLLLSSSCLGVISVTWPARCVPCYHIYFSYFSFLFALFTFILASGNILLICVSLHCKLKLLIIVFSSLNPTLVWKSEKFPPTQKVPRCVFNSSLMA